MSEKDIEKAMLLKAANDAEMAVILKENKELKEENKILRAEGAHLTVNLAEAEAKIIKLESIDRVAGILERLEEGHTE